MLIPVVFPSTPPHYISFSPSPSFSLCFVSSILCCRSRVGHFDRVQLSGGVSSRKGFPIESFIWTYPLLLSVSHYLLPLWIFLDPTDIYTCRDPHTCTPIPSFQIDDDLRIYDILLSFQTFIIPIINIKPIVRIFFLILIKIST